MVGLAVLVALLPFGEIAAQSRVDAKDDVFVAIAPCRILDTAANPAASDEQGSSRKVHIQSTRCGRIVPGFATSYSVTTTTISRNAPESLPQGAGPVTERSRKISIDSNGYVTVPQQSPNHYTAVDLDGYYVAAGTPLNPFGASAGSVGDSLQSDAQPEPGSPATNIVHSGTTGDLYLDGGLWAPAGVFMRAAGTNPSIVAQTGSADASSSFWVSNGVGAEVFRARSDGALIAPPTSFFDGRTDFFGSPGSYWGYVPIPGNAIHDVTLVNPMDAANSNQSRVTFFNAYTADEAGSPPITKFYARTGGYYSQENVNFHSSFHWHNPNQFHFRATSSVENNKDTFWVKAATNLSSVAQTRADMYVSGRVGIGTASPGVQLHVGGTPTQDIAASFGGDVTTGPVFNIGYSGASFGRSSAFFNVRPDALAVAPNPSLRFLTANVQRMIITNTGQVGIGTVTPAAGMTLDVVGNAHFSGTVTGGNIQAKYQDLAEWVPSRHDLAPGTVVVLDTDIGNGVMASSGAYDLTVAGVVSLQPGILLGEAGSAKEQIATTGRVRVLVDATTAPIRAGDLLVTSATTGRAMRSEAVQINGRPFHQPGTIIGKALEPLATGQGEILVLLSLQ